MDGFTFTDIFDTKGIEYLIIIGFLLLVIPFWIWLSSPVRIKSAVVRQVLSRNSLRIPRGIFFSGNHTWTYLEPSGMARVGLDDLLLKLTGEVGIEYVAGPMAFVQRGEPLARIGREGKHLEIMSPVSGHVELVHASLCTDPGPLQADPYGEGWICRITPENWSADTSSCFLAEKAVHWIYEELAAARDFIMESLRNHSTDPQALLVLQEGGELSGNPLAEMGPEVWRDFQEKFLDRT